MSTTTGDQQRTGDLWAVRLTRLCAMGDLPGLRAFYDEFHPHLGDGGHQHPTYRQCRERLNLILLELYARLGADTRTHDAARAQIEAGLLLRAVGPSSAVRTATLAAAAGDPRPLAALLSAEDRILAAAIICAALGAMVWPGPVLLDQLDELEDALKSG